MASSNAKKYPVWQLTDGTVIIQSQPEKLEQKISASQPRRMRRIRHWFLKALEQL